MAAATRRVPLLLRNAALVSVSMAGGDCACQYVQHRTGQATDDEHDGASGVWFANRGWWKVDRTVRMGVTGLCVSGPINHGIYALAERLVPGTAVKSVVTKIAVTAACAVPAIAATFSAVPVTRNT